jgi:hypothetical protein
LTVDCREEGACEKLGLAEHVNSKVTATMPISTARYGANVRR